MCSETLWFDAVFDYNFSLEGLEFVSALILRDNGSFALMLYRDKSAGFTKPPIDPTFPDWALPVLVLLLCQRRCLLAMASPESRFEFQRKLFVRCTGATLTTGISKRTIWTEVIKRFCSRHAVEIPSFITKFKELRNIFEGRVKKLFPLF